jgi:dTDP-4-dehydrorhamnose 3,5-epimerase
VRFIPTPISGAFEIEVEPIDDNRGFFARTWCTSELSASGLNPNVRQCSISFNRLRGTLRGLHFQASPHAEAKIVRCTAGSVFDVLVDLRKDSPTYLRWHGAILTSENRKALYIPEGFAHGFQTLVDDTEVLYMISTTYHPDSARTIRYDDPDIAVAWPLDTIIASTKDATAPLAAAVL